MPPTRSGRCHHCGQALQDGDYTRENRCPKCMRATHSCRNCRHYRAGMHNDCMEPVAERVTDKGQANFCDYFDPGSTVAAHKDIDALLRAADDLFS